MACVITACAVTTAHATTGFPVSGYVQTQDLRRTAQAVVEVKDEEGRPVQSAVTTDAGEFAFTIAAPG
ncbi:MAG TPA: hypothetical protein VFA38_01030, partial [Nitrospirales bacterium]|nr:hypothetical protein [Nitrospirales bacterium]